MDEKIKFCSFNCQSFNANSDIIQKLLEDNDIIFLQETLIEENNIDIFDTFNDNFRSFYISAQRKAGIHVGRASGGLAIFCRKSVSFKCIPVHISNRVLGVKIQFPNDYCFLILNVYLPCDYGDIDSLIEFRSTLADIANAFDSEEFDNFICVGDFNADPNKGRFFRYLSTFIEQNALYISDIETLPSESYSYISSNNTCSTSWIDHVVCSDLQYVDNHKILYGTTFYDHIPIQFDLSCPLNSFVDFHRPKKPINVNYKRINWDKVTLENKLHYFEELEDLSRFISYDVLNCEVDNCQNPFHYNELEHLYQDFIEIMFIAGDHFPFYDNGHRGNIVVGWNAYCKQLYEIAREKYLEWHINGRIRNGQGFEDMKKSRTDFKNALKFCRRNELMIRKENFLNKFRACNKTVFWKEISKLKGSAVKHVSPIDGNSVDENIVNIFDAKYKSILNDPQSQGSSVNNQTTDNYFEINLPLLTYQDLHEAILQLNDGIGMDGIHSNNLKLSGPVFNNILWKFFNKMLDHSFVPTALVYGEIRPIVKGSGLDKHLSDNYRPVMSSSVILKTFEYCLLPILKKNLSISNLQFGFRENTGCLSAVALLKETVLKYNKEGSDVHCAMIDLSKAFDRLNHSILFEKLLSENLDKKVVGILQKMYANSYVYTSFNGVKSNSWRVGNGIRQGGVNSPILFSYYINEILEVISETNIGCSIDGYKTNIMCFADDICILAPSAKGVQSMLDKLNEMLNKLCLTVNVKKSQYIIFRSSNRKIAKSPQVWLNGSIIDEVSECRYLGVMLRSDGQISSDIDRVLNSFMRQFNSMYGKFYYMDINVLSYLFKSFTSSFYGIELWFQKIPISQLNLMSIAYHKAIKRMVGLNMWDSNHLACEIAHVYIFKHLLARRLICFWHRLFTSKSPCMANLGYYWRFSSNLYRHILIHFQENYSVNISENPLCAVLSRIDFVQRHERRSHYIPE